MPFRQRRQESGMNPPCPRNPEHRVLYNSTFDEFWCVRCQLVVAPGGEGPVSSGGAAPADRVPSRKSSPRAASCEAFGFRAGRSAGACPARCLSEGPPLARPSRVEAICRESEEE